VLLLLSTVRLSTCVERELKARGIVATRAHKHTPAHTHACICHDNNVIFLLSDDRQKEHGIGFFMYIVCAEGGYCWR
jgi:hypothetical protein